MWRYFLFLIKVIVHDFVLSIDQKSRSLDKKVLTFMGVFSTRKQLEIIINIKGVGHFQRYETKNEDHAVKNNKILLLWNIHWEIIPQWECRSFIFVTEKRIEHLKLKVKWTRCRPNKLLELKMDLVFEKCSATLYVQLGKVSLWYKMATFFNADLYCLIHLFEVRINFTNSFFTGVFLFLRAVSLRLLLVELGLGKG